jgi:hypothetical protein
LSSLNFNSLAITAPTLSLSGTPPLIDFGFFLA